MTRPLLSGAPVLLMALVLVPQIPARAQRPDSTALPAVVVTATRTDVPVARDVSAVTVLRGEALERQGVRTLADALRSVPGVTVIQSGGDGAQASLFLRGGESDYVRVLVDGVPVNDPGGAVDLSTIGIDDIDRIEIVRGPASVLYGTDAVSGVVQVFTRGWRGTNSGDATIEGGSFGNRRWSLSRTQGGAVANAAVEAQHFATDGILPFNNAYRADAVNGRARITPRPSTQATLVVRQRDDRFHYPTDGAGAIVDRNAVRGERRSVASLDLTQALSPGVHLALTLATMDVRGRTDDAQDAPDDTIGLFAYRSHGAVRRRSGEARQQARRAAGTIASVGAEWTREAQANTDSSNYDVALNHFAAHRSNRATYVQLAGDRGALSWTVGGRYDDNTAFGAFRTARGGVAARLWRGGIVRATVGTAFKAPGFYEMEPTAFSSGNAALRPERARSWELGVRQALGDWNAEVGATWFSQRFRDLVEYAFQGPGLPDYFNVAAASARGVEITAHAAPTPALGVTGALTLLDTRVDDAGFASGAGDTFVQGARLLRRPARNASFTISANPRDRLHLDATVLRVGRRDDRDFSGFPARPVTLPAHSRVDVAGSYRLTGDQGLGSLSLRVRLDNALGARYQEIAGFSAPGRTLSVALSAGVAR